MRNEIGFMLVELYIRISPRINSNENLRDFCAVHREKTIMNIRYKHTWQVLTSLSPSFFHSLFIVQSIF